MNAPDPLLLGVAHLLNDVIIRELQSAKPDFERLERLSDVTDELIDAALPSPKRRKPRYDSVHSN